MASQPFESSTLELHRFDIARPEPLRIVKRSKTISGGSAPWEALHRGLRASGSSEPREGSPPVGPDRPLTVRKKRQGRGSVLDIPFRSPSPPSRTFDLFDSGIKSIELAAEGDDTDTTPKAVRPLATTAGPLTPMPHPRYSDTTQAQYADRNPRGSGSSDLDSTLDPSISDRGLPPASIPQRRFSRSKNFLLKAIGGRSGPTKHKSSKTIDSSPKNTLIRRLSGGRWRDRSSLDSSSGSASYNPSRDPYKPESGDTTHFTANSRLSSFGQLSSASSLAHNSHPLRYGDSFVLSAQVSVTPEAPSVDLGKGDFWAAIEIRGVLQCMGGCSEHDNELLGSPTSTRKDLPLDLQRYGYLHSMRVDLLPAYNCFITEIIGELHYANVIQANQTHLILARIGLNKCNASSNSLSSDELIADLENHLGNTQSAYLNIRLTYKHSGFWNTENVGLCFGGSISQVTQLQTDATAIISIHNSELSWPPQILKTMNGQPVLGPLTAIVEKHLPPDQARHAIRRLAGGQRPTNLTRVVSGSDSSGVGNGYIAVAPVADAVVCTPLANISTGPRTSELEAQWVQQLASPPIRYPPHSKTIGDDVDPARKIWNKMRQTSRGSHCSLGLGGQGPGHYYKTEDDRTPTRKSSSNATSSTLDTTSSEKSVPTNQVKKDAVQEERSKIMEIALRNKRSLGADTLRSMAPSVRGRRMGTMNGLGLGLGVGRTWGWGPSWW